MAALLHVGWWQWLRAGDVSCFLHFLSSLCEKEQGQSWSKATEWDTQVWEALLNHFEGPAALSVCGSTRGWAREEKTNARQLYGRYTCSHFQVIWWASCPATCEDVFGKKGEVSRTWLGRAKRRSTEILVQAGRQERIAVPVRCRTANADSPQWGHDGSGMVCYVSRTKKRFLSLNGCRWL